MIKTSMRMEQASKILKLMGDKNRLTMLKLLESQSLCVCEFVELFDISQPAISQHLRKLKDISIIKEDKRGQWVHYSINTENEYYPFVKAILDQLPNEREKLKKLEKTDVHCDM
ncbi:ArsR/SmtB family transcription factor [Fervidibacillus albus]|uniref:Metalloregulator ArsR/SmtB family transcription factor n=1 Tax=Fervidibacillus albus TaxID=2980026 RepID=A0A9E8RWQ7_9BACI|nr:metalloregulator ArsR/SmtB family transcription factor [Fervidibacillus albus]WAA10936.1 metalloregulator ArsR/SmtB family transcription factor [Fervidibacillus albus]